MKIKLGEWTVFRMKGFELENIYFSIPGKLVEFVLAFFRF